MSLVDTITDLFGDSESGFATYRCEACEHSFESYKSVEDVTCPDCLSRDVSAVDDAADGEAASD